MNAMYHLPHGDTSLLSGVPIRVRARTLLGEVRHTITTRKITFEVYTADVARRPADHEWIDAESLAEVPHPSYVKKALALSARTESKG